jgi:hypothetical protein
VRSNSVPVTRYGDSEMKSGLDQYRPNMLQPDLASYFDKSAAVVREYSGRYVADCPHGRPVSDMAVLDRFEKSYGTPALNYTVTSFDRYPVLSVSPLSLASVIPVCTRDVYLSDFHRNFLNPQFLPCNMFCVSGFPFSSVFPDIITIAAASHCSSSRFSSP